MNISIELTRVGAYVRYSYDRELNEELKRRRARFDKQGRDAAWILPESETDDFAAWAERQGYEIEYA